MTVSPSSLSVRKGETVTYTVTVRNTGAPIGEWRHGSLTWTHGSASANSPMSLRAADFDAPDELSFTGDYGYRVARRRLRLRR